MERQRETENLDPQNSFKIIWQHDLSMLIQREEVETGQYPENSRPGTLAYAVINKRPFLKKVEDEE